MGDSNSKGNGLDALHEFKDMLEQKGEVWEQRWNNIESFHEEHRRDLSNIKDGVTALQQIHTDTKHLSALPAIKEILGKLEGKLVDSATRKAGFETKDIALILAFATLVIIILGVVLALYVSHNTGADVEVNPSSFSIRHNGVQDLNHNGIPDLQELPKGE